MAFSFGKFLKKALNPLTPMHAVKGMNERLKQGGVKSLLDPTAGFKAMGGALGDIVKDVNAPQGQPAPEAPPADLGPAPQASNVGSTEAAGVPSPFGGGMAGGMGRFGPRRMGGGAGSMGRFGGGMMGGGSRRLGGFGQQGGGFEPELQQIIQDFYKKRGGGPAMGGGGGGFEQMGG